MSTGYGWEGIRQVCATLLGARHVPERLCSGPCPQRGAIASARPYLTFYVFYRPVFTDDGEFQQSYSVAVAKCSLKQLCEQLSKREECIDYCTDVLNHQQNV